MTTTTFTARALTAVTAVLALTQCADDTGGAPATPTVPPTTAVPTSAAPTSAPSTAAPPTTLAPGPQAIADAALLTEGEVGDGWFSDPRSAPWTLDAAQAARYSPCKPFLTSFFDAIGRQGAASTALFVKPGAGHAVSYVAVFPDATGARAMFDDLFEQGWLDCFLRYLSRRTPDEAGQHTSVGIHGPSVAVEPPGSNAFIVWTSETYVGKDGTKLSYDAPWAFVQVDRVVSLFGPPMLKYTQDELDAAIHHMAARAVAALAGTPLPGCKVHLPCPAAP